MLEVKDLEVYYGAIHAVKGISLRVEDGQIVTLIGSNGAGKSTTLHTISGLIKPRSGNILFDGTDITGTPAHKIVASGLVQVPDKPGLGVEPDMERIRLANELYEKVGTGARDDAMAMQYLIPGWKYDPKQPSIGRG